MVGTSRARFVTAVILALGMLVPVLATAAAAPSTRAGASFEQVIVVLHDTAGAPGAIANELGQRHNGQVGFVYQHALNGFSMELPSHAVAALSRDARVAHVERDQVVTTFNNPVPTGVDRIEADKKTGALNNNTSNVTYADQVDIAIIDTGIDHNHPDLNVVDGAKCTGGGPFSSKCSTTLPGDDNGHGTHVAGTAAAKDNGSGVVGVAPGANLYAVKVLRADGSGYMSWIVAGIDWVTARADTIEVANMSLGCECTSVAMNTALTNSTNAGVVYVVAAGNSGKDASTFSPANHERVIAVSAVADFDGKAGGAAAPTCRADKDDTLANFSNYGDVVDIAAPGVCINSTVPGGGYAQYSGTSMASPHAAGAAALYIVENIEDRGPTTWLTVRDGLQSDDWSVPQSHACGFSEGISSEHLLMLAACETASGSVTGSGTISGTVTDSATSGSISGAKVVVEGTIFSATTEVSGSYTISGVPVGDYTVTASAEGYESQNSPVTVNLDSTTTVDFSLTATSTDAGGTLSVDVITDHSTYTIGDSVVIRVTVTDESDPVADAAVAVTITTASGRVYTGSATTDGSGQSVVSFKTKRPDGVGSYTVDVTASKTGYTAGYGFTTFNVE